MREVLAEAIKSCGSLVSNYVDAEGNKGGVQLLHRVYQPPWEPCVKCRTKIKRIVLAQREHIIIRIARSRETNGDSVQQYYRFH